MPCAPLPNLASVGASAVAGSLVSSKPFFQNSSVNVTHRDAGNRTSWTSAPECTGHFAPAAVGWDFLNH